MTPERWRAIERLYHAALERDADERLSFLAEACRGDDSLRDEVESLLGYQAKAKDFIETPAATPHGPLLTVANAMRQLHESSVPGRFAGRVFGVYELKELIAVGGMGEVYRARDTRLGRSVAIKVLPESLARDPDRFHRLQQEARAAAALNHPNIVAVHDVGEQDGSPYIVEELIEGPTLREALKSGALTTRRAIDYAIQIASGLGAAHRGGLIHRDLKPDNIIVGADNRIRLLDFGLAKPTRATAADGSVPSAQQVTQPGVVFGTAGYMAPEQVRGEAIDHRADIFAFGAILYEMLTGRRAFDRPTAAETMTAVLKEDPTETTVGDMAPALERIVRRCLEKDPANRFDSARDIAFALETIVGSGATALATASRRVRPAAAWRWGVVAATVLIAAVATLRPMMVSNDLAPMRFSAVTNFAGLEAQPSLSPDGQSAAFVSNRDGQHDIWVGLVSGGNLIRITNDPNVESQPRWSPDGTRIAFSRLAPSGLADVWIVPALGGPSRRLIENASGPAWSWDGNRLAFSRAGRIWLSDANGANQKPVTTPAANTIHSRPSFSRDGTRVAFINRYAGPYSELAVVDLRTSQFRDLTQDDRAALSPVWSRRDFIYFTSSRGGSMNVWKIPSNGGEPVPVTLGPGDDAEIDLSADGARMLLATYRSNLNIAEIELVSDTRGRVRWLTQDSARSELAPAYSKDGQRLAYFSNRQGGEAESLWVMNADGSDATSFTDEGRISVFPRWGADGRLYYVSRSRHGAHELRRRSIDGGQSEHVGKVFVRGRWGDIAQDGRIVIGATGGKADVYDPRTRGTRTIQGVGSAPVWSRDGRLIASLMPARSHNDANAGIWLTDGVTPARQIFKGWVLSCAWASGALYAIVGGADGMGSLWKVPLEHAAATRIDVTIPLLLGITSPYWYEVATAHIDVHPGDRRIVLQAYEFNESDIVLVEHVR